MVQSLSAVNAINSDVTMTENMCDSATHSFTADSESAEMLLLLLLLLNTDADALVGSCRDADSVYYSSQLFQPLMMNRILSFTFLLDHQRCLR